MQYHQATFKNFKYKKFLKKAYEYLEKKGIYADKNKKKDLEKCIQNRISKRFFEHKKVDKTALCALDANSKRAVQKILTDAIQMVL